MLCTGVFVTSVNFKENKLTCVDQYNFILAVCFVAYRGNICSGLPNIHLQIIRITFECLSLPLFRTFPGQCLLIQCLIDLCTCSYGPMNVPSLIFLIPQFLLRTRTRMQSEGLVGVSSTTGLAMFPLATENGRSQRRKWPKRKP